MDQPTNNLLSSITSLTTTIMSFYSLPLLQVKAAFEAVQQKLEEGADNSYEELMLRYTQLSLLPLEQLRQSLVQITEWKEEMARIYCELLSRRSDGKQEIR